MEVKDQQRRQGGADPNSPGSAKERTLIVTMGRYLKKREKIQVSISEMECFLLSKGEEAVGIMSLAENARNEWGGIAGLQRSKRARTSKWLTQHAWAKRRGRIALDTSSCREQSTPNVKQNKLLAQMEREQTLRIGVPEEAQKSIFENATIQDRKISTVENKLIEASDEMNGPVVQAERL